ncbi:MAG: DEAD/DEAH box helicase family protein [Planctomycetes bacterium]|nr:DEAD/DEAH box helicase family protein [Planctomycetota bacterium]
MVRQDDFNHASQRGGAGPLDDARPLYVLPADNLAEEVLIPSFAAATSARCMVGFFSSAVLADLAPGLATFLQKPTTVLRLVVSPFLCDADRAALETGLVDPELLAERILVDGLVTQNALERHTLACFSYLLSQERIQVKVALLKDALFHPKVWLFGLPVGELAVHGSSNMTRAGLRRNFEQVTVSKSWTDPTQAYIAGKLGEQFERLWENVEEGCVTLSLPEAVKQRILREYRQERVPTEDEFRNLYRLACTVRPQEPPTAGHAEPAVSPSFAIPSWLNYTEGPFAHQGAAVDAWAAAGFRGTLEMATGSGKTLTSMIGAHRLHELHNPLLIVVAAPYLPLVDQWCEEMTPFGLKPVNLTTLQGSQQRASELQRIRRRLRSGLSTVEAVVASHDTLCTPEFQDAVRAFECRRLLIADEAHNLGRPSFTTSPPEFIEHRLALSATPVRQYDQVGTAELLKFFGDVVFRFTLEQAIGRCLVEYDYYVHPVELSETEMDQWNELTARIRQNAWRSRDGTPDDYLTKLLRDRRAVLETASGKIAELARLLAGEDLKGLRHTLVYASDKGPEQLEQVNQLLRRQGLLFHQLTAEETANRQQTRSIIKAFQEGEIQVLTAKRVLDEGVNIPQICRAYILASTTVERQWVQRRGRLLRTCSAIQKTHSVVHDFLALPPDTGQGPDTEARALLKSELVRAQEFARLARNAGRSDGPLSILDQISDAAFL